jgi:hypothetical protein
VPGLTPRSRPDVAEVFRERREEPRRDGNATPLVVGPVLVVLGLAGFLVPVFGAATFLAGLALLALAPGVLAVGWPPGASGGRGRTVAALSAAIVTLAVAGAGLLANPCANDPPIVALTGGVMALTTFGIALAVGRAFAGDRRVVAPILAGGVVAFLGFAATAYEVLSKVFLVC